MSKKPSKNPGMSSSFKASNIQTYAAGGPIKPPKWSLNYNPYSYNSANLVGGYEGFGNLGSQNLGISTPDLLGRENRLNNLRFPFSASVGLVNDKNIYNDTNYIATYDEQLAAGQTPTNESLLASKTTPYSEGIPLTADLSLGIEGSGINPKMKKRSKVGMQLEGGYNPVSGFYGQLNTDQKWALGNNYANALNRAGEWRVEPRVAPLNFQIAQKPGEITQDQKYEDFLQNNIATGNAFNQFDPNNPVASAQSDVEENKIFVSSGIGVGGQVKLPLGMLHGDIGVNRNWQSGQEQKYTPTANIGYSLPFSELEKIKNKIPKGDLSRRSNFTDASFRETQEEQGQAYIPDEGIGWGENSKVNASPLHKMWQPEANDVYLQSGPTPNAEPMTYDPTMGTFQNTDEMNNYSKGGGIHINPANKGKFTASANAADMGVQEFAAHVLANKGSYTPLQVQRANFAHNAAGWQHAQGGFNNRGFQSLPPAVQAKIKANSFADGGQLTEFNEGGTHEESPIGGIPQGMAPDGKMNLVEEGETKLNAADYVFSDQIKVDKETAALYDLPKGDIGKTFADVSKKVNRPHSRRENDTIEQVAIQRDLENLMQAQEKQKEMQKDKDVAEFAAKYPDLAQNIPAGSQQQMGQPQMQQPPMSPDAQQQMAMQEQMAPPAGVPQEQIDPAMMAQMGQMPMSYGGSLFNCGGKMYDAGGHMYGVGGNVMRGIGAGAYGIGEGLLDTLTFGLTDNLTDKGYNKLATMGNRSQSEIEKDNMIRGFGNVGGAVLGAGITGGAATSSAVSEGAEGLASGVSNIKGTGEKFDKIANGIGQGVSTLAGFMGPQGAVEAQGILKGNEAVNKLMNAKQNPFINQATQFAGNAMNSFAEGGRIPYSMYFPLEHVTQEGGNLNMPTNDHPYLNYLTMGGPEGEAPANPSNPTLAFNLNGVVANYTLEQAINDPLVLQAFGAQTNEKGQILPEDLEAAKLAIEQRFHEESLENRKAVGIAQQQYNESLSPEINTVKAGDAGSITQGISTEPLPGESPEQYAKRLSALEAMKTGQTKKETLSTIKQTPLQGAMMALPAAYNLGRGLFEKAKTLDYAKYAQKANVTPYTMNIDPQVAEVRKAYAGAAQAVKNAAPGGGAYLTNMANVAASKQKDMNDLLAKKEMFDKEGKFKADMLNRETNAQNLALQMQIQMYNDQAKAAKMRSIQEGLGQLADIATNSQGIDVQEQYLKAISPDFTQNFKYSTIFDQLQAAAKAKKAAKSAGKTTK